MTEFKIEREKERRKERQSKHANLNRVLDYRIFSLTIGSVLCTLGKRKKIRRQP